MASMISEIVRCVQEGKGTELIEAICDALDQNCSHENMEWQVGFTCRWLNIPAAGNKCRDVVNGWSFANTLIGG